MKVFRVTNLEIDDNYVKADRFDTEKLVQIDKINFVPFYNKENDLVGVARADKIVCINIYREEA